jgi:uncharacterized membrane protein
MKIARIFSLLMLVSLLAVSPLSAVFAQSASLSFTPSDGKYNTETFVGREQFFSMNVKNTGTTKVNNIVFTSEQPKGWTVEWDPERMASLESAETKRVDATITVPADADAGDVFVTLTAAADGVAPIKAQIRVTVARPIVEPKIEARALYPTLSSIAGQALTFDVEFLYTAAKLTDVPLVYNLTTKAPPNWEVAMTPPYEKDKKLTAMSLKPGFTFGDKILVSVTPPFLPLPDPGAYDISLTADSGTLKTTINLKAVITARYNLTLLPSNERYDTAATAGKDNSFSIELVNISTAAVDKINFSSTKPSGWTIDFNPKELDSLAALDSKTVEVNIKPPPETIAGDYVITLQASSTQTVAPQIQVRVTVETPTIWGWVGVAIIFVVIVGLIFVFMRFSRR